MHKSAERIDPDVAFHAEPPFIALLRLVHLGIALLLRVLSGRRRIDNGGVHHSPTLEHMPRFHHDAVDGVEEQLVQAVLFQQMAELQQRRRIQKIHRKIGVISLRPAQKDDGTYWTKPAILQEFGFPILSKEIATKIEFLQNQSPKSETVRHAIVTGETGAQGGYQTNSRMKLAQKWLEKFAGYENEKEGTNYQIAPFKVSAKCCCNLKEKPCTDWAKEHNKGTYDPWLQLLWKEHDPFRAFRNFQSPGSSPARH